MKLKSKRDRGIDEVIADARAQIKKTEPELDVEFTQVLQDMIGDLSNAPEPIQIKVFASDPALLADLGPRIGDAIGKIGGVVDVQNGIDNTISGPATNFQIDPVGCRANGLHARGNCRRCDIDSGRRHYYRSADREWKTVHSSRAIG